MSCSKKDEYKYTKLQDVKEAAANVNLYGILTKVLKTNVPTTSGRFHTMILVKDDTLPLDKTFRMHFFIREEYPLEYLQDGNIFRFHRVKVEGRNDEAKVDGRIFNSTDVVMFPRVETPENKIHTSAKTIQFTESDKKRISELREIANINSVFDCTPEFIRALTDSEELTLRLGSEETIGNDKNGDNDVDENEINRSRILRVITSDSSKVLNRLATQKRHLVVNPFSLNQKPWKKRKSNESDKKSTTTAVSFILPEQSLKQSSNTDDDISKIKIMPTDTNQNQLFLPKSNLPGQGENEHPCLEKDNQKNSVPVVVGSYNLESNCNGAGQSGEECEDIAELTSAADMSRKIMENPIDGNTNVNANPYSSLANSMQGEEGSCVSVCPGLACAGQQCTQEPILLEDDDPRLEDFDSSLLIVGHGDIPAVNDHGNTIYRSTECMPFGDGQKTTRITANFTVNFQWPRNRVKVKIVDIKPSLQALQSYGEKNLLSGICSKCGSYTMYSRIVWNVNKESKLKKPMCLACHENGVCSYICLQFRLRLTVQDAWGSRLKIYAVKENACVLLGCSEREYQSNNKCRQRTIGLLSEALSSKAFLHLEVYKANTYTRIMHYVCNTSLSVMLNDPTKT